jgi:hypothetical protein
MLGVGGAIEATAYRRSYLLASNRPRSKAYTRKRGFRIAGLVDFFWELEIKACGIGSKIRDVISLKIYYVLMICRNPNWKKK